jgi:regulatory protein
MKMDSDEIDTIIVKLIQDNFLNESRFACSFARGKHLIKFWGKTESVNELKFRNINNTISISLKEISNEEYLDTLKNTRNWESIKEN